MTFQGAALPWRSAETRWALRRVKLPPGAQGRMVIPAHGTPPDDREGPPAEVLTWWVSLTEHLLREPGADVRLARDVRRWWGTGLVAESASVQAVRALVVAQDGTPSSAGIFTLAWGVQPGRGRLACRGAAFSVADHLGLCLCAPESEWVRLGAWLGDGFRS